MLWQSTLISGSEASEERLKSMTPPRILHIATHGYFLPSEDTAATGASGTRAGQQDLQTVVRSPLFRSGLVLAGANSGGQRERLPLGS